MTLIANCAANQRAVRISPSLVMHQGDTLIQNRG
jgi:hypothetical protein